MRSFGDREKRERVRDTQYEGMRVPRIFACKTRRFKERKREQIHVKQITTKYKTEMHV